MLLLPISWKLFWPLKPEFPPLLDPDGCASAEAAIIEAAASLLAGSEKVPDPSLVLPLAFFFLHFLGLEVERVVLVGELTSPPDPESPEPPPKTLNWFPPWGAGVPDELENPVTVGSTETLLAPEPEESEEAELPELPLFAWKLLSPWELEPLGELEEPVEIGPATTLLPPEPGESDDSESPPEPDDPEELEAPPRHWE